MNKILNFLGLMKKAGKLVVGDEACYDSVRTRKAKLILVASDASPNALNRAKGYAGETKGGYIKLPATKSELGQIVGRESCAILAVTDKEFAEALVKKLPPECLFAKEEDKKKNKQNSEGERGEL
ncbi:MAG: ribosomal L7Ae/L30e/S12e/Gadd45 family protein [Clostridiales bacterium]|nr:ribosomal L7Ae/L30e/S12e/Gadd45 family protein [Clostridiales bacterium]